MDVVTGVAEVAVREGLVYGPRTLRAAVPRDERDDTGPGPAPGPGPRGGREGVSTGPGRSRGWHHAALERLHLAEEPKEVVPMRPGRDDGTVVGPAAWLAIRKPPAGEIKRKADVHRSLKSQLL